MHGAPSCETSTVTTTSTVADHRLGTVGRAIPGAEVKIADDGEILVRGPHVFRGYYGTGDTTAFGAVTDDGWLHTGDLGYFVDDYLIFKGRGTEMIKTLGSNVAPREVEAVLESVPGVGSG